MLSELNFITGKADEKTKYFNVFPCFDPGAPALSETIRKLFRFRPMLKMPKLK